MTIPTLRLSRLTIALSLAGLTAFAAAPSLAGIPSVTGPERATQAAPGPQPETRPEPIPVSYLIGTVKYFAEERQCLGCPAVLLGPDLLANAIIEVWDDTGTSPLVSGRLDRNGGFDLEVPNAEPDGIDPYLRVYADDGRRATVFHGETGTVRWARAPNTGFISGGNLKPGATYRTNLFVSRSEDSQALFIFDQLANRAFDALEPYTGWGSGPQPGSENLVEVFWPKSCQLSTQACYRNGQILLPTPEHGALTHVLLHEYAHFVHSRYAWIGFSCVFDLGHSFLRESSPSCAWVEGWATFLSMQIRNDPSYGSSHEFEHGSNYGDLLFDEESLSYLANRGRPPHDDFEAVVAAILWDFYDGKNEAHDQVRKGMSSLWDIAMGGPSTLTEFLGDWQAAKGLTCEDTAMLRHHLIDREPFVRDLTLRIEPPTVGLISADPLASCPGPSYLGGTLVELQALATDNEYEFSHWTGDDFLSLSRHISVTMNDDLDRTANFCVSGNCPAILVPSPMPLRLRGSMGETVEAVVTLQNPDPDPVDYQITSLDSWLRITDTGPLTIEPEGAAEVLFEVSCPDHPEQKFGAYELETNGSFTLSFDAEMLCATWEIEPPLLELVGEPEEVVWDLVTIRSFGDPIEYFVYSPELDIQPESGLIWSFPAQLLVETTCPDTAITKQIEVPIEIDDGRDTYTDVLSVILRCGDDGGTSAGDPHLITHDGLKYDFQGLGEFIAADGDGFEVQVRQETWRSRPVSVNTAVAARVGEQRVAFYRDQSPMMWIDGVPTGLEDGATLRLAGGTVKRAGSSFTIAWSDGSRITVWRRSSPSGHYLNMRVSPGSETTSVAGLLGNKDGDRGNDLFLNTQPPTVLSQPVPFEQLHREFADSWRITTVADSLFDYGPGQGPWTFNHPGEPAEPITLGNLDPDLVAWARSICRGLGITDPVLLDACILDVALTGDPGIGEAMVDVQGSKHITVYENDFEAETVGPEWSPRTSELTPIGQRKFLGQFSNTTVTLELDDLPAHDEVTISMDLYILKSWDGNLSGDPDRFDIRVDGIGRLSTSFSNIDHLSQGYPDNFGADWPSQTGAVETDTLGYSYFYGDAVYRWTQTLEHTGESLTLELEASGLQPLNDESWGVDNVTITVSD